MFQQNASPSAADGSGGTGTTTRTRPWHRLLARLGLRAADPQPDAASPAGPGSHPAGAPGGIATPRPERDPDLPGWMPFDPVRIPLGQALQLYVVPQPCLHACADGPGCFFGEPGSAMASRPAGPLAPGPEEPRRPAEVVDLATWPGRAARTGGTRDDPGIALPLDKDGGGIP